MTRMNPKWFRAHVARPSQPKENRFGVARKMTGARSDSEAFERFGIQLFVAAGGQRPLKLPASPKAPHLFVICSSDVREP
jgi:hypothetical protein